MVPSQSTGSDVSTLPDMESDLMQVREQTSFYVPFHRRWSHDDRIKPFHGEEGEEEEEGRRSREEGCYVRNLYSQGCAMHTCTCIFPAFTEGGGSK